MDEELKCNCGRIWAMEQRALLQRSRDREPVFCTCGRTLDRWRGALDYPKLVQDIKANMCECGCGHAVSGLYSRYLPGHDPAAKAQA